MKFHHVLGLTTISLIVALGASGCLSSIKQQIEQKAKEKAVETFANAVSDENLNLDLENDIISVKLDDGSTSQIGAGAEVPRDWPADVPLPDGITHTVMTTNEDSFNTVFESDSPPDVIFAFYKTELIASGWTLDQLNELEGTGMIEASKDNRTVNFIAAPGYSESGSLSTLSVRQETES